jgi:hypothetical protein
MVPVQSLVQPVASQGGEHVFGDLPLFLLACTVTLFWGTVVLLVRAKWLRYGPLAGDPASCPRSPMFSD